MPHNGVTIEKTKNLCFNSNFVVSNNYCLLSAYYVPSTVLLLYEQHLSWGKVFSVDGSLPC